jgi:hypothetical protein
MNGRLIEMNKKIIQAEDCLHRYIQSRHIKSFEKYFGHFFSVFSGIQWGFGQQNWMLSSVQETIRKVKKIEYRKTFLLAIKNLFRIRVQLAFGIQMLPYLFDVVPVLHNTVFHGIL